LHSSRFLGHFFKNFVKNLFSICKDRVNIDTIKNMKGGLLLTLKQMVAKHPNRICIISPNLRLAKTGYVKSWKVIQTVSYVDDAKEAIGFYEKEGLHTVAYSTCTNPNNKNLELPPDMVAAFYRCYYNQEVSKDGT
jgi:hypothetical protein